MLAAHALIDDAACFFVEVDEKLNYVVCNFGGVQNDLIVLRHSFQELYSVGPNFKKDLSVFEDESLLERFIARPRSPYQSLVQIHEQCFPFRAQLMQSDV